MEPRDVRSQPAPRRYSPMQRFRPTGCSGEEGDREAHQGQPCQTGGCKNRKGLVHRQLLHGQNLKQFLRHASVPAWGRCNPLRQRRQGSGSWPAPPRLSPIPEKPIASGLPIAVGLGDQRPLDDPSSIHEAVPWPSSAMGVDRQRQRGPTNDARRRMTRAPCRPGKHGFAGDGAWAHPRAWQWRSAGRKNGF